ncbi:hypothetical protein OIU85_004611 [Salix viminalis]|uniref:Secreted protein n=1 Tax=Salix viminalis TaxID=40686 RepID=A0A9Q0SY81_SALVM|nr:hypothetical protein OIU85_004611 [Salix viminalis]
MFHLVISFLQICHFSSCFGHPFFLLQVAAGVVEERQARSEKRVRLLWWLDSVEMGAVCGVGRRRQGEREMGGARTAAKRCGYAHSKRGEKIRVFVILGFWV